MPTIISGDTGIDKIAAGAIEYADLPTGSVLQVVTNTYSTQVSNNSSTFVDTGLTCAITPKFATSKILVLYSGQVANYVADSIGFLGLFRGATQINSPIATYFQSSAGIIWTDPSFNYLDSPATTSSTTYAIKMKSGGGTYVHAWGSSDNKCVLTLIEVAA